MTVDQNGPVVLSWFSVIVGMISGLIMGDMNTGLMIGGTFQLMSLGVAHSAVHPHQTMVLQPLSVPSSRFVQEPELMQPLQSDFRYVFWRSSWKLLSIS